MISIGMNPGNKLILLMFLTMTLAVKLPAQSIYAGRYKAVFTSPPQKVPTAKTPDAPLAGNGDIGLTLGGESHQLRFYLGKNDFWRAYPVYPGGGIAFPGGFDINIFELKGAEYYVEQVLDEAYLSGKFTKGDLVVNLISWVSATTNTVIAELSSNKTCNLSFQLWSARGNTSASKFGVVNNIYWATRSFESSPLLEWPSHVAMAMKVIGAEPSNNKTLTLNPGRKVFFALKMLSNQDSKDWRRKAIKEAEQMTIASIQEERVRHQNWWAEFWNKSEIRIPDTSLEKYYYASQYLFACSSRSNRFAPGIWGPFITQDSTAWGGDYHLNYNYQAPYWASFSSNHIDLTENFDQPLLDYMEKGKQHAKELLNQKGIYYPVGIGPKGLVTTRWPLTQEEMLKRYATRENTIDGGYKFLGQKINAVFSVGNMLMRFYSTYDKDYAKTVYPYLQECANFWEDYLKFENGRYVIYMDHFNEVMPNLKNNGHWRENLGDFNSTLSLGLVKMLFKGIIDMSSFLEVDAERQEKWKHIVENLSNFPIGEVDGRYALKSVERNSTSDNPKATGLSRVSIHGLLLPGGIVGPKTDPELNKILLSDVSHWKDKVDAPGDWGNTLGNGVETSYPGAVRVGYPADEILKNLKDRILAQSLPNLWVTQGGGGIETLAAVPLTINEMLLQSYEGVLRVFPNWNRKRDASFKTLRAYGAFLVSSSLKDGKIRYLRIFSEKGRSCLLENPWPGKAVQINRNGKTSEKLKGELIRFPTSRNELLELQEL